MKNLIASAKAHLVWCILFSLFSFCLVFFFHPQFPTSSFLPFDLPFYVPLLAFSGACWLIYVGLKKVSLLYLFTVIPLAFACNIHLLRPDLYFLWLCLIVVVISNDIEQITSGILLILAGMYLWTAVQKMNVGFVDGMVFSFKKRLFPDMSPEIISTLVKMIPAVEFLLAVLCITKYTKLRILFALIVHGSILFFIIKGGWNYSMIIWNMVLLTLHVLLPGFKFIILGVNVKWFVTMVTVTIVPVLYFIGISPNFVSWTMYSGRLQHYRLQIDEHTALDPPEYIRDFIYVRDGVYSVSISEWSDAATGGAPCMEPIFKDRVLLDCERYIKANPQ